MPSTPDEASQVSNPLIEGHRAVMVWHGGDPPTFVGDFNDWGRGKPVHPRQVRAAVWNYTLDLPLNAYIEYSFMRGDQRVLDPFNERRVPSGLGYDLNWFAMPDYQATPLIRRQRGIPHGTLVKRTLTVSDFVIGGKRRVQLYCPAAPGPYPLVVVLDGQDYGPRGRLIEIVDNLIGQQQIKPVALALVDHGGQARFMEYGASDMTLLFLLDTVLPFARDQLDLVDPKASPGAFGILGASMGGLSALYAGLRHPEVFGHIISQSGAFSRRLQDGTVYDHIVYNLVLHSPIRPMKVWMDCGIYDFTVLRETNRRMSSLLQEKGYKAAYQEYAGGHNYTSWRNEVWQGLVYHFGQPEAST